VAWSGLAGLPHRQRPNIETICIAEGAMMHRIFFTILFSLGMTLPTLAVEPGSIDAYFRPSEFSQVSISPDGVHIAARRSGENYETNIILMNADSIVEQNRPEVSALTSFEVGGVGNYMWKTNDRLVFIGQADIREEGAAGGSFVAAYSIGIDGSQPRKFLDRYCQTAGNRGQFCYPVNDRRDFVGLSFDRVLDRQIDDDRYITVFAGESMRSTYTDVFRIDTRSGRLNKVEVGPAGMMEWFPDNQGALRLGRGHVRGTPTHEILYRETEDSEWQSVHTFEDDDVWIVGFDADDRHIIILSTEGYDQRVMLSFDPVTGEMGEPLAQDPIYDIESVRFSDRIDLPRRPIYAATRGETVTRYYLDEEFEDVQATVDYYFPDTINDLVDWDDAHNRFVIRAWNDRQAGRYYLLDMEAGKLRFLFDARPWQNPEQQGEMRPIEYTARDGLQIRGYITLPVGWDGEPVPLILNPHGGPHGPRDAYGWRNEPQFFASRGWATLQVNYRGSGGYGETFERAGYMRWGLEMQDDLTDAVGWAVEQGFADPDRVCIYGASYGGYATLQGLVKTPDLYQCGVSYVAVSSLTELLDLDTRRTTSEYRDTMFPFWMQRTLGPVNDEAARQYRRDNSPLYHVDQIQAPLLAIHGEADPRVDIDTQFYPLIRELRSQDKEFERIVGPYEGHGFFTGDVTIELYAQMEAFLARYLN
jgi:dipeptidyl aminopeptidase/acylaminoacyl peptidase